MANNNLYIFQSFSALALLASVLGQPPPLEKDSKISYDLNDVNFILWTTELGLHDPLPFYANSAPIDLLKHRFNPNRPTKILAHGWTSEGKDFADDFAQGKITKNLSRGDFSPPGIKGSRLATCT